MKKFGPEYADVAASHNKLGLVHRQLGDLKQAKDCHKRAPDVNTENLGHEHEKIVPSCNKASKRLSQTSAGCLHEKVWT